MNICIIAEKPSVARDIARIVGANTRQDGYLEGNGYMVTWAMGHLIALAMPEAYGFSAYKAEDLPIRPNPFQLVVRQVRKDKEYVSDPAALKQLKVIRSCFDKADRIIVATDAGREGELIFRYIYHHLGCRKPFDRLWISSLTDKAIREGLSNLKPGSHYDNLYYSAKARSEADWLVGINASRALSIARKGGYSLGRVQTPTLAMVCRRYIENRDFSSVPYWKLSVAAEKEGVSLKAVSSSAFDNEADAQSALALLREQSRLTVTSVARRVDEHGRIKVGHTSPPLLYDLTSLQKEANKKHGFSADKTLSIAQSLYEKKITTYPRTGSRYISEDVFEEVPTLLGKIGTALPTPLNRHSVDNGKVTDHHAIIPTGETTSGLSTDETTIYQMVVHRFIEAFSPDSEEERMQAELTDGTNTYIWKACRSISLGWKAVQHSTGTNDEKGKEEEEQTLSVLPNLIENEVLPLLSSEITEHKTKPKPLYTEATLLSAMENAGKEVKEDELNFVVEHKIGVAADCDEEMKKDLNAHWMGECSEVGMYLAMSRQADREGYPEIAEAFKRYAFEEADHASRFCELLGDNVWDTKTNLYKRMIAESGACEDKNRIAKRAKELGLDAIHDTVHEMARDEARHGRGFAGLYKRYFDKFHLNSDDCHLMSHRWQFSFSALSTQIHYRLLRSRHIY